MITPAMVEANKYETLMEALEGLNRRGFVQDFKFNEYGIYLEAVNVFIETKDLSIVEFHKFEGTSDPADGAIVFAIESKKGFKGVLIDAVGMYHESSKSDFLNRLSFKN